MLSRIGPAQQLTNATVGIAVDNPADDFGEIGVRLDAVNLCGFDERGGDGLMLRATVESDEQCIFLVRANGGIERSTVLEPIPTRLSSRKRREPCQRESA